MSWGSLLNALLMIEVIKVLLTIVFLPVAMLGGCMVWLTFFGDRA